MNLDFHRLGYASPKWSWWRPLALGGIGAAFFGVFTVMISVVMIIPMLLDPFGESAFDDLVMFGVIDFQDPTVLTFTLISVIVMLPALILAALIIGPRPLGLLSSVAGRLRWGWMLRLLLPGILVFVVFLGGWVLLATPEEFTPVFDSTTLLLLALILLLVPVQATAEEYVFRGYLMQAVGTWLKHPAWAILLPVPLFVLGHLYDVWGLVDVAVMAIFAGWLTWRTGGLEAAIVVHVVNNVFVFALGAVGLVDTNSQQGDPLGVAVTIVTLGTFSGIAAWMHQRSGMQRTRYVEPVAGPATAPPHTVPPHTPPPHTPPYSAPSDTPPVVEEPRDQHP